MIKVELEINGRKVKIEADNAQDIADAVKMLTVNEWPEEKQKKCAPVYPDRPLDVYELLRPPYSPYYSRWYDQQPIITWTSGYVREIQ